MPRQHQNGDSGDESENIVAALERGVRLLRCFSSMESSLSGKELIERTRLPKATVFRLANTLIHLGLLRYSQRLARFSLAPGLLTLATPLLTRLTIRQLARPLMLELANYVGGQVVLAAGDHKNLVMVEVVQAPSCSIFRPEVGTQVTRSRSASGRAYLASLPHELCDAYLRELSETDPATAEHLKVRLNEARTDLATKGFCRNYQDLQREIDGVAAPMKNPVDDLILVFAVTVQTFNTTTEQLNADIGPRLASLVRNLEMTMGHITDTRVMPRQTADRL